MSSSTRLSKILIANRGEIACRIIRTAKMMGVKTVAVYSDADAHAMHVSMADEAYNIGPPSAQESYLRGDKLIKVAKSSGAQGIHPGYGFLSENSQFATDCKNEGVVFIGPPASAVRDMGIKSKSKEIMIKAGVPVIPGYHGEDQSEHRLLTEAKAIGFPLLIKAIYGGGGKGMRIVNSEDEFFPALESARREALRAFGNDEVLLERYVAKPRHVEVQVFGDSHGNYVHLFERDCSVQRRHQKVIEQAPAPGIDDELRLRLGEAGVQAAAAVGYQGAGTVEFILDTSDNSFYFMEMNTRLQVEHPVTEMVTGQDLVEWQLRVASGEVLPLPQSRIVLNGHSVEARIYAESVPKGFIPTAGPLDNLSLPSGPFIRVETGVRKGDSVSVHYDPMIAKLVVWDPCLPVAFHRLYKSLSEFNIVGVENNVDFLKRLCMNRDLIEGRVHTGFIEQHRSTLIPDQPEENALYQVAMGVILSMPSSQTDPFLKEGPFRLNHFSKRVVKLKYGDKVHKVEITFETDGWLSLQLEGNQAVRMKPSQTIENDFQNMTVETPTGLNKFKFSSDGEKAYLFSEMGDFTLDIVSDYEWGQSDQSATTNLAVSPMPGVVEKIFVEPGQTVKKGDTIAVVIAMKMEHAIKAVKDGTVSDVLFKPGENVAKNVPLVKFKDD